MNVVFNEIQDRMDRQDTIIATLHEERPQRVPNARRQARRADANLNRHALRPSKQYWITCPRKLKSEFDRTPQPNVYK